MLNSRECMMAILLLLLCGLAFITNAGGLIHAALAAAVVMFAIHFIKMHRNRPVQLWPSLGLNRLKETVIHERNATPSHCVKYKIRM